LPGSSYFFFAAFFFVAFFFIGMVMFLLVERSPFGFGEAAKLLRLLRCTTNYPKILGLGFADVKKYS
jgi:hypothetical protein